MARKSRQLRGRKLIAAIKAELGRMVNLPPETDSISVSTLARRLNISRQTIYSNNLRPLIDEFIELQQSRFGQHDTGSQRRRSFEDRIDALEKENAELKMKLDRNLEQWAAVEHNARMLGINADDLFLTPSKPPRNISR